MSLHLLEHAHSQSHNINRPGAVVFLVERDGCRTLPPLVCRVTSPTFVESISTIFFNLMYSTQGKTTVSPFIGAGFFHLQRVPDVSRPSICKDLSLGIGERKVKEKGEYDMRQRG